MSEFRSFHEEDVRPGLVVRMIPNGVPRFFDSCIVSKVSNGEVYLERPMMRVMSTETLCPSATISVERYHVSMSYLICSFQGLWSDTSYDIRKHGFEYRIH